MLVMNQLALFLIINFKYKLEISYGVFLWCAISVVAFFILKIIEVIIFSRNERRMGRPLGNFVVSVRVGSCFFLMASIVVFLLFMTPSVSIGFAPLVYLLLGLFVFAVYYSVGSLPLRR